MTGGLNLAVGTHSVGRGRNQRCLRLIIGNCESAWYQALWHIFSLCVLSSFLVTLSAGTLSDLTLYSISCLSRSSINIYWRSYSVVAHMILSLVFEDWWWWWCQNYWATLTVGRNSSTFMLIHNSCFHQSIILLLKALIWNWSWFWCRHHSYQLYFIININGINSYYDIFIIDSM